MIWFGTDRDSQLREKPFVTQQDCTFLCGNYIDVAAADADLQRLRSVDVTAEVDAAVLGKRDDGRAAIYHHEPPLDDDNGPRLAVGLAVTLLPAVGLDTSDWVEHTSTAASVTAGHIVAAMSRSDLEEFGRHVDDAMAILIVAGPTRAVDQARSDIVHAQEIAERSVLFDLSALEAKLDRLGGDG